MRTNRTDGVGQNGTPKTNGPQGPKSTRLAAVSGKALTSRVSRRDFLKGGSIGLASLAMSSILASCQRFKNILQPPTETPTSTPLPTQTPIPTNTPLPSPTPDPDAWMQRADPDDINTWDQNSDMYEFATYFRGNDPLEMARLSETDHRDFARDLDRLRMLSLQRADGVSLTLPKAMEIAHRYEFIQQRTFAEMTSTELMWATTLRNIYERRFTLISPLEVAESELKTHNVPLWSTAEYGYGSKQGSWLMMPVSGDVVPLLGRQVNRDINCAGWWAGTFFGGGQLLNGDKAVLLYMRHKDTGEHLLRVNLIGRKDRIYDSRDWMFSSRPGHQVVFSPFDPRYAVGTRLAIVWQHGNGVRATVESYDENPDAGIVKLMHPFYQGEIAPAHFSGWSFHDVPSRSLEILTILDRATGLPVCGQPFMLDKPQIRIAGEFFTVYPPDLKINVTADP